MGNELDMVSVIDTQTHKKLGMIACPHRQFLRFQSSIRENAFGCIISQQIQMIQEALK